MGARKIFKTKVAAIKEGMKRGLKRIYELPDGSFYVGKKSDAVKRAKALLGGRRKKPTRKRRKRKK